MDRTKGSVLMFIALLGWALALSEDGSVFGEMRKALRRLLNSSNDDEIISQEWTPEWLAGLHDRQRTTS